MQSSQLLLYKNIKKHIAYEISSLLGYPLKEYSYTDVFFCFHNMINLTASITRYKWDQSVSVH